MAIGRIPEPGTGIPESIVDAKGDIVTATAADTPARLAVGTNDHRLVAASGEATGLKYVADTQNTVVDAKGDLLVGTAADTIARLAVGTNGHTLVADSAETTGLKWAAPAGGGMTLISTTTLSGSSITLSSIPQTYKDLRIIVRNFRPDTATGRYRMRINGDSNTRYKQDLYLASAPNTNFTFGASFWELEDRAATSTGASQAYGDFTLPDYTNSTTWKMIWGFSFVNNTTTSTNFNFNNYMSIYNQTPAITSLEIFQSTGNFTSGDVLLYGVK
jgi:hypothetical protein